MRQRSSPSKVKRFAPRLRAPLTAPGRRHRTLISEGKPPCKSLTRALASALLRLRQGRQPAIGLLELPFVGDVENGLEAFVRWLDALQEIVMQIDEDRAQGQELAEQQTRPGRTVESVENHLPAPLADGESSLCGAGADALGFVLRHTESKGVGQYFLAAGYKHRFW